MATVLHYLLHYPLHAVVGSLFYIGVCVYAVLRGRQPLRLTGIALLINFMTPFVVSNFFDPGGFQLGVLLLDLALLAFMAAMIWRFFERWLVAATAAQFVSVCVHLAKLSDPTINGWIYITAVIICSYAVVMALAVALILDHLNPKGA